MEITEICLKNIKGFDNGEHSKPIKLSLKSGKVNLLVAPNGFGKSSLAIAFESLKQTGLKVSKENKYKQDDSLNSEISITFDGKRYTANDVKNDISKLINCHVIHSDIYPKSITMNMGIFSSTRSSFGIREIPIRNIPKIQKIEYKFSEIKKTFGKNGKLLNNLGNLFTNAEFLGLFTEDVFAKIDKLKGIRIQKVISNIKDKLNSIDGTASSLMRNISDDFFCGIENNPDYAKLKQIFCKNLNNLDAFTRIWQIIQISQCNKTNIKDGLKYHEYIQFRNELNKNISDINTTWKRIECKESNNELSVCFPDADVISNGQRDILTFSIRLQVFKSKLKKGRSYFLIIDEVFDYLDNANILAAQYYLSNLIKYAKDNDSILIPCILTHLDPRHFRSYVFGEKMLNVSYIKNVEAKASDQMKSFIAFREDLAKNEGHNELWAKLSKYCFHYYPDYPDFRKEFEENYKNNKIKSSWMSGSALFEYLLDETSKYLSNNPVYDPYAVSLSVRIASEKLVYEQLETAEDKKSFLDVHCKGTKDKMMFAEEKGILIPDTYYILSLIHGESDHISYNKDTKEFNEKPIVYSLNNEVVKHMIAVLFSYQEGTTLSLSVLH